jgi:aminoglycoside 6-adenylyltransferase
VALRRHDVAALLVEAQDLLSAIAGSGSSMTTKSEHPNARFLHRIVRMAERCGEVRMVVMTGSMARDAADADSDLDVELFTVEPERFAAASDWLDQIGSVVMVLPLTSPAEGAPARLAVFQDAGVPRKIDITILPADLFVEDRMAPPRADLYRRGYAVLLDKDGLSGQLRSALESTPPAEAHLPAQDEFTAVVEEFFFEVMHILVCLRRGDLWTAKVRDAAAKGQLLQLLEWHARARATRAVVPSPDTQHLGRGMSHWLDEEAWERLHGAFGQFDADSSREALHATVELFRHHALELAAWLDLAYPWTVDDAMSQRREGNRHQP